MLDTIITDINTMYFNVDLIHGTVVYSPDKIKYSTSVLCRNIYEANLFSLNILRQNIAETEFKTGKKPEFITRVFLGIQQDIETVKIIPTMKWLQNTFPEKLI